MFANPKWFKRRKYLGWGITPATWQGWLYLLGYVAVIGITTLASQWLGLSINHKVAALSVILGFIALDAIHIMRHLGNDERETQHEALSERNAAWAMLVVLGIGIFYQVIQGLIQQTWMLDPFLVAALFIAVIAKSATNKYLSDK